MSKLVQVLRGTISLQCIIDASCRLSIETYVIQNRTGRWNKTDIYTEQNKLNIIFATRKKYSVRECKQKNILVKTKTIICNIIHSRAGCPRDICKCIAERVLTWTSGAVFPMYGNLQLGLIVHVQGNTPSLDTGLQL